MHYYDLIIIHIDGLATIFGLGCSGLLSSTLAESPTPSSDDNGDRSGGSSESASTIPTNDPAYLLQAEAKVQQLRDASKYAAIFMLESSRKIITEKFPMKFKTVHADHVTIEYAPSALYMKELAGLEDVVMAVEVVAIAEDDNIQTVSSMSLLFIIVFCCSYLTTSLPLF
jgi:hypothetical protein